MESQENTYDQGARETVELGNRLAEASPESDLSEVAEGLLAGAIQYWLYAHQPCGDPECEECKPLCTAELRLEALKNAVEAFARSSEYFHTPGDFDAGRA